MVRLKKKEFHHDCGKKRRHWGKSMSGGKSFVGIDEVDGKTIAIQETLSGIQVLNSPQAICHLLMGEGGGKHLSHNGGGREKKGGL